MDYLVSNSRADALRDNVGPATTHSQPGNNSPGSTYRLNPSKGILTDPGVPPSIFGPVSEAAFKPDILPQVPWCCSCLRFIDPLHVNCSIYPHTLPQDSDIAFRVLASPVNNDIGSSIKVPNTSPMIRNVRQDTQRTTSGRRSYKMEDISSSIDTGAQQHLNSPSRTVNQPPYETNPGFGGYADSNEMMFNALYFQHHVPMASSLDSSRLRLRQASTTPVDNGSEMSSPLDILSSFEISCSHPPTTISEPLWTEPIVDLTSESPDTSPTLTPDSDGAITSSFEQSPRPPNPKRRYRTASQFKCNVSGCGGSYSRRYELQRHQLTHSGMKKHGCRFPTCDRSGLNGFARKDHLIQHLKQVHHVSR